MTKRQRNDHDKFVLISMIAIGMGMFLFGLSLFVFNSRILAMLNLLTAFIVMIGIDIHKEASKK